MTVVTLRPDSTVSSSGLAAGNPHTALSDNSDGTTVGAAGGSAATATMTLGTSTLPAGAVTKSLTARIRARAISGSTPGHHKMRLTKADGTILVDWFDSSWTATFSTKSSTAVAWTGTQADIDGLRTWIHLNAKQANPYAVIAAEAYCDLRYVAQPTISLDSTTATLDRVTSAWTYSQPDSDGGIQSQWVARVFTAAQYGAGGFDPATSSATAEASGSGTTNTVTITSLPDGASHRIYIRAADSVNGSPLWTAWSYATFTVTTTRAQVSTVTATAVPASGMVNLVVNRDTGQDAWSHVDVQRSVDGGAVWVDVVGASSVVPGANTVTIPDRLAPSDVATLWRARAVKSDGTTGSWVQTTPALTWTATAIYLRDVTTPTNEVLLSGWQPDGFPDDKREIPTAVLDVIGRPDPVVVWDVPKYRTGSFRVDVASLAESNALTALLDGRRLMILQPAILGPSMLIQPTGWTRERTAEQIATEGRYVTVDYIQVG